MQDLYKNLTEMCDYISDEIASANKKIKASGNKLTSGDLDYVDKLTHALKSIKTTKAMIEAEDDGYSYDGRNYDEGSSYARGRGRYAKRDSMGRYASENRMMRDGRSYGRMYDGRSYDDNMVAELRELMEDAPNQQMRQKFQDFISEIERMK